MPLSSDLEQLVLRTNPWLLNPSKWLVFWSSKQPSRYMPRNPIGWSGSFPKNKATLVIGPRQSGKSTFLGAHIKTLGPQILIVNCEEPLYRAWCKSPAMFMADLREFLPSPNALFFDEVHHLDEAGLFLKGLVDLKPGFPILATGSSSYHLLSETRESLAGRASRVRLLPFSLNELSLDLDDMAPAIARVRQKELFSRMLIYGSYPEVWLSDTPEVILSELLESVVMRDASDLFRIDNPEAFRRLVRLMAGQVANLVNLAEWASICGISAKTVSRYIGVLEETQIVTMLRPWISGKRAELTSAPKLFFVDNGVRNAALARYYTLDKRDDIGVLFENCVLTEIIKSVRPILDTVGFWRTRSGAEVDFVIETGGKTIAVEAKAGAPSRLRLTRSAQSFITAVKPDLFITVHQGESIEREFKGCKTLWINPSELPDLLL
ncbi:MAG: ATP-binding protein [Proteobacteria bacterium]|nr:ATP-binding protein [Pseudomonadota bacterium]